VKTHVKKYSQVEMILLETKRSGGNMHRVLVGKPEGKRPVERPRRRWEDNIKMNLQEVAGGCGTGWRWLRIGTGDGHL
jgi:hypothetical protein